MCRGAGSAGPTRPCWVSKAAAPPGQPDHAWWRRGTWRRSRPSRVRKHPSITPSVTEGECLPRSLLVRSRPRLRGGEPRGCCGHLRNTPSVPRPARGVRYRLLGTSRGGPRRRLSGIGRSRRGPRPPRCGRGQHRGLRAARSRALNGYEWAHTLLARDAPGDRQQATEWPKIPWPTAASRATRRSLRRPRSCWRGSADFLERPGEGSSGPGRRDPAYQTGRAVSPVASAKPDRSTYRSSWVAQDQRTRAEHDISTLAPR